VDTQTHRYRLADEDKRKLPHKRSLQKKFDAIYSSDLPRAIETANPLARLTGAPLETTDALRERSVGVMEGLTFEEAANNIRNNTKRCSGVILSMYCQAGKVTGRHLIGPRENSMRPSSNTKVGASPSLHIPAHLHSNSALLGALDSPELKPVWIATANCGIARLELRDDGFVRLIVINDTRHLAGI